MGAVYFDPVCFVLGFVVCCVLVVVVFVFVWSGLVWVVFDHHSYGGVGWW